MDCGICQRIAHIKHKTNPHFVAELQTGYVVMGDHQLFRGYALLLCKEHKAELHELDHTVRMKFLEEMSALAEAVFSCFQPVKLNYELLGNSMPHMHWHIFPRHADDPRPIGPVWVLDKRIRYAEQTTLSPEALLTMKRKFLRVLQHTANVHILSTFQE